VELHALQLTSASGGRPSPATDVSRADATKKKILVSGRAAGRDQLGEQVAETTDGPTGGRTEVNDP
jgi:hypothetical protein